MNRIKFSLIDAIVDFFVSLVNPTWDCTKEDLDNMGVVKGKLPVPIYRFVHNEDTRA